MNVIKYEKPTSLSKSMSINLNIPQAPFYPGNIANGMELRFVKNDIIFHIKINTDEPTNITKGHSFNEIFQHNITKEDNFTVWRECFKVLVDGVAYSFAIHTLGIKISDNNFKPTYTATRQIEKNLVTVSINIKYYEMIEQILCFNIKKILTNSLGQ